MKLNEILSKEKGYNRAYNTFVKGIKSYIRAWKFVKEKKGVKKYFIIPFLLNLILLSSIFYISFTFIYPEVLNFFSFGDEWYISFFKWLISPFLLIILTFVIGFLYSLLGNIICAPFNDPLSIKVETLITDVSFNERFSFLHFFKDMVRISLNTINLLLLISFFNLVIFFINVIPIVGGMLYSVLSFMSVIFFIGFQFFDFPLDRRKLRFGDKLKVIWEYKFMTMGLGFGFSIFSIIPIFGFLSLNLGTVGATLLFIENIKPRLKKNV